MPSPLMFDHTGESPAYVATCDVPHLRAANAGGVIPAGALVFFTVDLLPNGANASVTLQYVSGQPTEPGGFIVFRNHQVAETFIAAAGFELAKIAG